MESNSSIQLFSHRIIAPFFLMFGREAAVKHMLLASESPKYLGTEDNMINIELMAKLYLVVAHNLNKTRKARDGNNKKKNTKNPEQLKIGDNVLVRDHTSKAFQPKYKDFCIIGLLGKNQVEIKDNHGHTTKVHHRDVKKIPMTEKVCQLYVEEQVGKVRNGKKDIPDNKMPDLGWDATEELEVQEVSQVEHTFPIFPETIIAIAILVVTFLENIKIYIQEIPKVSREIAQAVTNTTKTFSRSKLLRRASETYRKAVHAITDATRTTPCNSRSYPHRITNSQHHHIQNRTSKQKPYDEYEGSYCQHNSNTSCNNHKQ